MKAVIDRFEGDYAVVFLGEEEIKVNVPRKELPQEAKEGSWLRINFELDTETTKRQEEKIRIILDKLKKKK